MGAQQGGRGRGILDWIVLSTVRIFVDLIKIYTGHFQKKPTFSTTNSGFWRRPVFFLSSSI